MSEPLTSFERAERLFKQAEKLGCDSPTENMIAEAIQDAEFDTLHNPEIISERHGQKFVTPAVKMNLATTQNKLHRLSKLICQAVDQRTDDIDVSMQERVLVVLETEYYADSVSDGVSSPASRASSKDSPPSAVTPNSKPSPLDIPATTPCCGAAYHIICSKCEQDVPLPNSKQEANEN